MRHAGRPQRRDHKVIPTDEEWMLAQHTLGLLDLRTRG